MLPKTNMQSFQPQLFQLLFFVAASVLANTISNVFGMDASNESLKLGTSNEHGEMTCKHFSSIDAF